MNLQAGRLRSLACMYAQPLQASKTETISSLLFAFDTAHVTAVYPPIAMWRGFEGEGWKRVKGPPFKA